MGVAKIIIDVVVNGASNAAGEIDQTASRFDKFSNTMGKLAVPAGIALGAIAGVATGAVKAASDMEQATGGVNAVFKGSAGVIQNWATTAAQDVGMAGAAYKTTAAGIGGALAGMGVPLDQAAQQTGELITRAADLASVFGGDTVQATDAMTAAFRGEYDGLQRLIPSISGAAIEAEMAAQAAEGQTFASEEAAKASAIYATIMDKSAASAGNFANESDTAAGAQQRAQAQFEDTAAELGKSLLPAFTAVMGILNTFGQWVSQNIGLVTTLTAVIAGVAAAVLAVNAALAIASAAQAVWTGLQAASKAATAAYTAVQWAFNAAMAANPIGIIIIAIIALVAGIGLLWQNSEAFRDFFIGMWEKIADVASAAWDVIVKAASVAWDAIKAAVEAVWKAIQTIIQFYIDAIKAYINAWVFVVTAAWNGIKIAAEAVWNAIKAIASAVLSGLQSTISAFGSAVTAIWNTIKSIGSAIWGAIKSAATTAINAIMAPINAVKRAIDAVISGIKSAISFASSLLSKIPVIGGLFGGSSARSAAVPAQRFMVAAATPNLAARGLLGASSLPTIARGNAPTVIVNGALDPVAVARQIREILVAQDRRVGGVRV